MFDFDLCCCRNKEGALHLNLSWVERIPFTPAVQAVNASSVPIFSLDCGKGKKKSQIRFCLVTDWWKQAKVQCYLFSLCWHQHRQTWNVESLASFIQESKICSCKWWPCEILTVVMFSLMCALEYVMNKSWHSKLGLHLDRTVELSIIRMKNDGNILRRVKYET